MESLFVVNNEQSLINSRVESVDDPIVNNALFRIYEALVNPLRTIETLRDDISNLKILIESTQEELKDIPKSTIISAIVRSIILGIVSFTITLLILAKYVEEGSKYDSEAFTYITLFGVTILFKILAWVGSFIAAIRRKKQLKKEIDAMSDKVNENEATIYDIENQISTAIKCVPIKYRYSRAVEIMALGFAGSNVDNLKEAVNYCDAEMHRQNTDFFLTLISENLCNVAFNQLKTQSQIDDLRRDVWLSNILS